LLLHTDFLFHAWLRIFVFFDFLSTEIRDALYFTVQKFLHTILALSSEEMFLPSHHIFGQNFPPHFHGQRTRFPLQCSIILPISSLPCHLPLPTAQAPGLVRFNNPGIPSLKKEPDPEKLDGMARYIGAGTHPLLPFTPQLQNLTMNFKTHTSPAALSQPQTQQPFPTSQKSRSIATLLIPSECLKEAYRKNGKSQNLEHRFLGLGTWVGWRYIEQKGASTG